MEGQLRYAKDTGVGQAQHPYQMGEATTKYKLIFVGDNGVGKTAVI